MNKDEYRIDQFDHECFFIVEDLRILVKIRGLLERPVSSLICASKGKHVRCVARVARINPNPAGSCVFDRSLRDEINARLTRKCGNPSNQSQHCSLAIGNR